MAFTANILSWPFRHLNIVGCLLKRRPTKGGSRAPQDPPPPLHLVLPVFERKENKARDTKGDDQFWCSNAAHVACLFENLIIKAMFLLKIMLIYDEPLLRGQPLLSGHLPIPRGWPL